MSHRNDPRSSKDAAAVVSAAESARVKDALLDLLREQSGAPFELQRIYLTLQPSKGWPAVQPQSVNKRLSELKNDGLIVGTGELVPGPCNRNAERLALVSEEKAA